MERKTLLWGLTVLVIGAFILEFFVVLMWTPSQADAGATATPDASKAFTGAAYLNATILGFEKSALVQCNSTEPGDAAALEGIPGVAMVVPQGSVFGVVLNKSLSSAEFAPLENAIVGGLSAGCNPVIFRVARVRLDSAATFTDEAGKNNVTINDRQFEAITQQAPMVFVYSDARENESIVMAARLSTEAGQLADFAAQQVKVAQEWEPDYGAANATGANATGANASAADSPAAGNASGQVPGSSVNSSGAANAS